MANAYRATEPSAAADAGAGCSRVLPRLTAVSSASLAGLRLAQTASNSSLRMARTRPMPAMAFGFPLRAEDGSLRAVFFATITVTVGAGCLSVGVGSVAAVL